MTGTQSTDLAIGHPAPQRHKVNPLLLLLALLGGPAAWLSQLLFAFAVTSYFCFAPVQLATWVRPAIVTFNLLALCAGAAALLTAASLLRQTHHEHENAAPGAVDTGEGRTRFLAIWGICASSVFIVATLANVPSLFLVHLCAS